LRDWHGLTPCVPVPAGGMTRDRVAEMLDFYGTDIMLLIGGALLEAGAELEAATAAFVAEVQNYRPGPHHGRPQG
jgi:ribulose-bisphosphate carboxylase large chain